MQKNSSASAEELLLSYCFLFLIFERSLKKGTNILGGFMTMTFMKNSP